VRERVPVERAVHVRAPVARVWKALVDPALLEQWMGVPVACSWEPGASLEIGGHYPSRGTVLAVEPERRVQYDQWSRITRLADRPENRAIVTLEIEPDGDGTLVRLHYLSPPAIAGAEHARFYWNVALDVLRRTLEG